jgi:hypothetical protein
MKRFFSSILLAFFIIFLLPSFGFSERGIKVQSRRLALVIGNGAYKTTAHLRNPVNDAQDMAYTLENLGFEVIHRENAERKAMILAIMDFGRQLRKGGIGLFYFAGHGIQVDGRNYLIPVDAKIESESDVEFGGVDAGRVLGKMEDAENDLNIVILDACRNNPFSSSFRTSTRGLARMDAPKGSLIAYSTAPGSVAADGEGRNGIYTKHLLKYMKTPGLTVEQILKRVRMDVTDETQNKQVPWESSSLVGEFYFVAEEKMTVTKAASQRGSQELEKERKRLQQERERLEQLKIEIEKKKLEAELERLKAEKEKLKMASLPRRHLETAPVNYGAEIRRDGVYVEYANGIVRDTKTGLEWKVGPNENTSLQQAMEWVESMNIESGGWRMPSMKQLKSLYEKGKGFRNMTPLLRTNGWLVWSGETQDSKPLCFDFRSGARGKSLIPIIPKPYFFKEVRAFAVRSVSQ